MHLERHTSQRLEFWRLVAGGIAHVLVDEAPKAVERRIGNGVEVQFRELYIAHVSDSVARREVQLRPHRRDDVTPRRQVAKQEAALLIVTRIASSPKPTSTTRIPVLAYQRAGDISANDTWIISAPAKPLSTLLRALWPFTLNERTA